MAQINIHATIDDDAIVYCRTMNAAIRHLVDGPIVFSDESAMRLHVTLVVGQLHPHAQVEEVAAAIAAEVGSQPPLALNLMPPHLWSVQAGGAYVFADVANPDRMLNLRAALLRRLEGSHMTVDHTSMVQPHVTLAYVPIPTDALMPLFATVPPVTTVISRHVEISHSGPFGTCVDSLRVTSFAGGAPRR